MGEDVKILMENAPTLFALLIRGAIIFVPTLGTVYILGRMLGILKSYRSKNVVAVLAMLGFSYWSIIIYEGVSGFTLDTMWRVITYTATSSLFYVLIGFSLYERFDNWLDKKLADDKKDGKKK